MTAELLLCIILLISKAQTQHNNDTTEQGCLEESTNVQKPVIWPTTTEFNTKVVSEPLCLTETLELITRVCNASGWNPKYKDVPNCGNVTSKSPDVMCPPGFNVIYDDDNEIDFCYKMTEASNWSYPCINSGSSSTIFDLRKEEFLKLISHLELSENKHVWLPATRIGTFGPLIWTTPGDKWGQLVNTEEFSENNELISISRLSVLQNCLLLDLEKYTVKTENCSFQYPSLCITREEHLLQLHCPQGYYASQYGLNDGLCYGVHISDEPQTWDEFYEKSCSNPITIKNKHDNYIAKELFLLYDMDYYNACWTGLIKSQSNYHWQSNTPVTFVNWDPLTDFDEKNVKGAINDQFKWQVFDNEAKLFCMICQIDANSKNLEIELKYVSDEIQLIIYNPQRLWKEADDDFGIRCFSNAKGFQTRIFIKEENSFSRFISIHPLEKENESADVIERITYRFQPLNDQSGEYWCEGHDSKNFSLIKSSTLYIPVQEDKEHIFVLKLVIHKLCETIATCNPDWEEIIDDLEELLNVDNIRLMAIDTITNTSSIVTLHVSVQLLKDSCKNTACQIFITYKTFRAYIIFKFSGTTRKVKYTFIYLKSTEFCLMTHDANNSVTWEMTKIGETVAPAELCMQSNGLPISRQCRGSFIYGGDWGAVNGYCTEDFEPTNRTAFLYSIAKGRADMATTNSFLVQDLTKVLQNKEDFIPADLYFLGLSIQTVLRLSNENSSSVEIGDSLNIATAIDSIMNIEKEYIKLAQTMNSSNLLLESVDLILSKIALNLTDDHFIENRKDLAITPHFVIQISSPQVNNISGLAIAKNENNNTSSFEDLNVIELTSDMTLNDVLAIPNLDTASWVSRNILDSLQYINSTDNSSYTVINPRVIFEVFYNDIVFQETKKNKDKVNSRVISITIPEYETELAEPVYLIYRKLEKNASINECAYWDLGSQQSTGEWSKKGCYYVGTYVDLDICACLHLTHFAQLVHGFKTPGKNPENDVVYVYHGKALNTITVVGCSLSLVGIAGIAATAIIFPTWRHKPGSKILLQLSGALALESLIMLAQDSFHPSDPHCIALGALLHYSVLASFIWMLLTALLQFARYVRVLGVQRPVRFMIKFSVIGWGLPIIPVAILLIVDSNSYLPPATIISEDPQKLPERDPSALCYPQGLGLILCCLLPIACIVLTNSIVFILVMRSITRAPEGVRRPTDPDLVLSQLRLSILLFFLLGLSWIFGFLAATSKLILFSYLFCITATLQGFILFMYFIICDPTTRVLWVSLVREKSLSPSKTSTRELSIDTK